MIDKHFTLSCYALEHPFRAYYSHSAEMIELIDINNDIYQFRLPDHQHYEKMEVNCAVKQYFRYFSTCFILYQSNVLIVQRNGQPSASIQRVKNISVKSTLDCIAVFLVPEQAQTQSTMKVRAIVLKKGKNEINYIIQPKTFLLLNGSQLENYNFQKYISESQWENGKIEYIFGHFCLTKHKELLYSVLQLSLDSKDKMNDKILKYQILSLQLPQIVKIIGSYQNTVAFVSQMKQQDKAQKVQQQVAILNGPDKEIVCLKGVGCEINRLEYFVFKRIVFILQGNLLLLYSLPKGVLLTKVDITAALQVFEQGSSIIVGEQHKQQSRYCLLLDQLVHNLTYFYLADKQKMAVYLFNLDMLLQQYLIEPISATISDLANDKDQIHLNVMKTLNFRSKKLNTLEQYLNQAVKTMVFGHVLRFLQNQENIFVLNDGLFLLSKAVQANIEHLSKQKSLTASLQKQIVELCSKLISESKYEDHLFKGLTIVNNLFSMLRTNLKILKSGQNTEAYAKLLQSKRAVRLLKQDKSKQLFQLCYQLAINVKGYDYLEQLQNKKK